MSLELAEAFIQAGELADALDALDEHLDAHPDDHDARRLRIEVLIRTPGRAFDALVDLDALPELTEKDHLIRLRVLEQRGFSEGSGAAFVEAYRLYPHYEPFAQLALAGFYSHGQIDPALELLASLPKTPDWLLWSGKFYTLKGEHRIAVEHYSLALDQIPPSDNKMREVTRAGFLLARAGAYLRLREFEAAAADYAAAEVIVPTDPMIGFSQSLIACEQGNVQHALALYRTAFERAPEDLRGIMQNTLREDGRYAALYSAIMG